MAIIYALVDPTDNEIRYVGYTSVEPTLRLNRHIKTAKSNNHRAVCEWIRSLLSIGLLPNIYVLEMIDNEQIQREAYWIDYGKKNGWKLTNATIGGCGVAGYVFTDEVKKKISDSSKAKWADPQIREKIIASRVGLKRSEETRKKMSAALTGIKRSEETCKKIGDSKRGMKHTDEAKRKISEGNKKHPFTEEHCKKLSAAIMGNKNNLGKHPSPETIAKICETKRLRKLGIFKEQPRSHHATK